MYPELLIVPMREELTKAGVKELLTAEDVDAALADKSGTALVIVNSVCGCAAGKMRPGVRRALQNYRSPRPRLHRIRRTGPRSHRARPSAFRQRSAFVAQPGSVSQR